MKRFRAFLCMLVLGAVLGGAVYAALRPERGDVERKLGWLAAQLDLTPEQQVKIRALHERYCPEICRLAAACGDGTAEARGQCREATMRLVQAVSAELTAAQRARYHTLVARCLVPSAGAAERP